MHAATNTFALTKLLRKEDQIIFCGCWLYLLPIQTWIPAVIVSRKRQLKKQLKIPLISICQVAISENLLPAIVIYLASILNYWQSGSENLQRRAAWNEVFQKVYFTY